MLKDTFSSYLVYVGNAAGYRNRIENKTNYPREEIKMTETETWWEPIFTGAFALGFNKERMNELEEESFLYFKEDQGEMDTTN